MDIKNPTDCFLVAFMPRTHEEQALRQRQYSILSTVARQKAFVKEFATRTCELARLPYFDVCRMIVVDPMHNLLLGKPIEMSLLHKS
jgi:hypothetical protein